MEEKASDVIGDALRELIVAAPESDIEADEAQTGIRYLNRMMAEWAVRGYNLGYTEVEDLGDPVTVPNGVSEAIVSNLAIRMAAQYGVSIDPANALIARAEAGLNAVRHLTISVDTAEYPSILPMGSGVDGTFFPEQENAVYGESNSAIIAEDNTDG